MIMAPRAEVDDGLFDVVIAKAMSRREVLGLFPQIFTGRHIESPLIEYFTCASVEAAFDSPEPVTPDGELFGSTPLAATIHPAALEVYCL
jgi:diacylglycerol kinase (ATP)